LLLLVCQARLGHKDRQGLQAPRERRVILDPQALQARLDHRDLREIKAIPDLQAHAGRRDHVGLKGLKVRQALRVPQVQ
jgi:hypothetical protein